MSATLRLALAALALSIAPLSACGTAEDAALDELPIADEELDGKADQAAVYSWIRPSIGTVRCLRAPCASHVSRPVNSGEGRNTYLYDLRSLRLSAAKQESVTARLGSMLLRGRYAKIVVSGQDMPVFQVTRALEPVGEKSADSPTADRYYSLTGVRCLVEPCPLAARPLNGTGLDTWESADLGRLQLGIMATSQLSNELPQGAVYVSVSTVTKSVAAVTQAFRSVR